MDGGGPTQLQDLGSIDGDEISIITDLFERWPGVEHHATIEWAFRLQLDNVVRSAIGEHQIDSAPIVLPITLELVEDDRVVTVDEALITFRGVSAVGFPAWAGVAEVESGRVVSLTSDGGVADRADRYVQELGDERRSTSQLLRPLTREMHRRTPDQNTASKGRPVHPDSAAESASSSADEAPTFSGGWPPAVV